MAAVQWTGSTLTGLCLFNPPVRELVSAVSTRITGTYGVHMNIGRIGIPNGVGGHVDAEPLGGILVRFFETRDSL